MAVVVALSLRTICPQADAAKKLYLLAGQLSNEQKAPDDAAGAEKAGFDG
ncbi:hypothetical protein [Desulfovibrio sp.]|nr:hypothetical protein [Desulfovibrio sp.]